MKKQVYAFWQRHRVAICRAAVILALGAVYYVWVRVTSWRIPCLFHVVTGLLCPGCGITRFFLALFRLDVAVAVRQNAAVAVLLPVWCLAGAVKIFLRPRACQKDGRVMRGLLWGSLIVLLVFGVLRNLPWFWFLRPTM